MKERLDYLYNEIINKLNEENINANENIVSLKNVQEACDKYLSKYNKYFIKNVNETIKNINKRLNGFNLPFKSNKYSNLINIKFYVMNGKEYLRFIFRKNDLINYISFTLLDGKPVIESTNFMNKEEQEIFKKSYDIVNSLLILLNYFTIEYPNVDYSWDKDHRNMEDQSICDGIFKSHIYLNNPEDTHVGFSNFDDIILATRHSSKYGKLYDYLVMYKEPLLLKTPINIEKLNPFISQLVTKYLQHNNHVNKLLLREK